MRARRLTRGGSGRVEAADHVALTIGGVGLTDVFQCLRNAEDLTGHLESSEVVGASDPDRSRCYGPTMPALSAAALLLALLTPPPATAPDARAPSGFAAVAYKLDS